MSRPKDTHRLLPAHTRKAFDGAQEPKGTARLVNLAKLPGNWIAPWRVGGGDNLVPSPERRCLWALLFDEKRFREVAEGSKVGYAGVGAHRST